MPKRLVAVIDIDTTIANCDHRAVLLQNLCVVCGGKKETRGVSWCNNCQLKTDGKISQSSWDAFLHPDLMLLDVPEPKAVEAIKHMRARDIEFHFITGRNETLRSVTEQWLSTHVGWDSTRECLYVRGPDDHNTPASVYKEGALKRMVEEHDLHDVSFIFFEDDEYVFRMYSKYGICVKCPEGWEHFCPPHGRGEEAVWNR